MRVQLLVTGDLERLALHRSLGRLFPEAEFLQPLKVDGFTSARIGEAAAVALRDTRMTPSVRKMAAKLVAEVEPGRRRHELPDLVIAVDDLELANVGQPGAVTDHFRKALDIELEQRIWSSGASRERAIERLASRCSFHLLSPMVEAYFFGEVGALTRAGMVRQSAFPTGTGIGRKLAASATPSATSTFCAPIRRTP